MISDHCAVYFRPTCHLSDSTISSALVGRVVEAKPFPMCSRFAEVVVTISTTFGTSTASPMTIPPPPFINAQEVAIPKRLILKEWFRCVFVKLRKECEVSGTQYPGDLLTPPDIHGEFIPSSLYADPASGWRERVRLMLLQTLPLRDHLIDRFLEDREMSGRVAQGRACARGSSCST